MIGVIFKAVGFLWLDMFFKSFRLKNVKRIRFIKGNKKVLQDLDNNVKYAVPGKVFLLGEYYVLDKGQAILLTTQPSFILKASKEPWKFTKHSPADRLITWALDNAVVSSREWHYQIVDPYQHLGGFGASTAEFLLLYRTLLLPQTMQDAWNLYRTLHSNEKIIPSGADLIAQWQKGVCHVNIKNNQIRDYTQAFDWTKFFIFSAAHLQKTPTHAHLKELKDLSFVNTLEVIFKKALISFHQNNEPGFAQMLNAYSDALELLGLEHAQTTKIKKQFLQIPEVYAVKGSGAMQSDILILWLKDCKSLAECLKLAEFFQLRFIGCVKDLL
jgi:hypothetical protein